MHDAPQSNQEFILIEVQYNAASLNYPGSSMSIVYGKLHTSTNQTISNETGESVIAAFISLSS